MKKPQLIFLLLLLISGSAIGQLTVDDNGNVGINDSSPSYLFDFYGYQCSFDYSYSDELRINLGASDPRLTNDNKVVFINHNASSYIDVECKQTITHSDSTAKENFNSLENKALSKVLNLKGYNFNWKDDSTGALQAGLLAQQVEREIPEAVLTNDTSGTKMMTYTTIIPYLVEAIKEQQKQLDQKTQTENDMLTRISNLENEIEQIKTNCCDSENLKSLEIVNKSYSHDDQKASLSQNLPNPFNETTRIAYFLPKVTNSARLYVYNMQGKQIKNYMLNSFGNASLTIEGKEFQPGMYFYTLIADGKEVDTKRMILTD